jgi:RNA polymerase sigma factor (sigma-70 family)
MQASMQTRIASKPVALSAHEHWVDKHRDYLFRYALTRLPDVPSAEDAVQETFLAALKAGSSFAGRSSEKNWMFAILKNKIYDHFRRLRKETSFTDLEYGSPEEHDGSADGWPDRSACLDEPGPQEWRRLGEGLDRELFWNAYRNCCRKIPRNVVTAFHLREVDGIESKEICRRLNVSEKLSLGVAASGAHGAAPKSRNRLVPNASGAYSPTTPWPAKIGHALTVLELQGQLLAVGDLLARVFRGLFWPPRNRPATPAYVGPARSNPRYILVTACRF